MVQVCTTQQQMFGECIDGDVGVRVRIWVPKLANNMLFVSLPAVCVLRCQGDV